MPRDMRKKPYSKDEARVAAYFFARGTGGGDDPIGSILASHSFAIEQRNIYKAALETLRGELEHAIAAVDFAPVRELPEQISKKLIAGQRAEAP